MVGAVEDVVEAHLDKSPSRLVPARIEPHQPRISGEGEGPLGPAGREEAEHRGGAEAQAREREARDRNRHAVRRQRDDRDSCDRRRQTRTGDSLRDGTDHGRAGFMLALGNMLKVPAGGKLFGTWNGLQDLDSGRFQPVHTDFRAVYAALLDQWLGWSPAPILGERIEE